MNVKQTVNPNVKKKQRRKRVRKILIVLIIVVLLTAFLIFREAGKKSAAVAYKSYTAAKGTISNSISLTGNLQAVDSEILAASSSSKVRKVFVAEGDSVKDGDSLMLLANGQKLTASFDGTVNKIYVDVDDKVNAGDSLVQVVDFSHLKVNVNVDEYDINDVYVGQECRIVTTASDFSCTSSISSIDYVSSSGGNVANYTATAYLDGNGKIYPGMQVSMTIPKSEAVDVVVLKMEALQFDSYNKPFVLIAGNGGNYDTQYVETGVSNGNYVEIKSGVEDGTVVYAQYSGASSMEEMISQMMNAAGERPDHDRGNKGEFSGPPSENQMPAPGN